MESTKYYFRVFTCPACPVKPFFRLTGVKPLYLSNRGAFVIEILDQKVQKVYKQGK